MTTQFVLMYHPALGNRQATVPLQSADDHASNGWLLVDPAAEVPASSVPYLTQAALLSQISAGAAPVGTALRAAFGALVSVKVHGAKGDGTTDDTAAIQAAITAAQTANVPLYFPAGDYRVTAPLTVNPRRSPIRGDGAQTTRIVASGLASGAWLLTLGWDNAIAAGNRRGPYDSVSGITFVGPTGGTICNGVRFQGAGTSPAAYGQHVQDVGFYGFGIQASIGDASYINSFQRCRFDSAVSRGFSIDQPVGSGENLSFVSCLFSGSPGTLVYFDMSGGEAYFFGCSFDYSARALHQRSGHVGFTNCHFEAGSAFGPATTEFLRVDRRGSVQQPILTITDCEFYADWDNYETGIRLTGDTFGGNALRLTNPYVRTKSGMATYLIRDDGPTSSDVTITGAWYSDAAYVPQIRDNAGRSYRITPSARFVNRPERSVRRVSPTAIEPFPAVTARGLEAPTNGTLYMTMFSPTEDIDLTGLAFWTGATAQAGATLFRVGLYEWDSSQATLRASAANDTALGTAAFTRYAKSFTAPYTCIAGKVYGLALLVVGATTPPIIVSSGNAVDWLMKDATYGHPVSVRATGQTDLATPIFPGSQSGPEKTFYMVGIGS